jgi:CubicO group peptidase (beta-lactamase class C family)
MRLISTVASVLLLAVATSPGRAQQISSSTTNPATQKSFADKTDEPFAKWNKPDSPGCALGVIRDGKFVYTHGYGMASLDHDIPINSRTVFYIASMSKQFTAMSIALLIEEGKLSLEDDIRKYLPEMPRYQSPIRIRHLIHHTSGIRDFIVLKYLSGFPTGVARSDDEAYETMARTTNEEVFKLIARQKGLNFAPGEESSYSNSNYALLAEIVKRVSGKSLPDFAEENIFKPLGMVNTHYYDDLFVVVKNRATGYAPREAGGFVPVLTNNGTVGPAGVLTTVEDLLLWDRNFYQNKLGGGGQGLIDLVLTPDKLNDGRQLQYAFGLIHYNYRGLDAVGHDGGFFGFKTSMNRFPRQRFTVICLCNSRNAPMDVLADQVTDIYLAGQFKQNTAPAATRKPISLTEPELAKFVGTYWNPITEGLWMLSLKDGNLVDPGGGGSVLVPIGKNRFQVAGQPVELIFETSHEGGHPGRMLKITSGGKPQVYEVVEAARPSLTQLIEYAGRFRSNEIDAAYTVIVQNGKLTVARKQAKNVALTPTFADNFWNDEFGYIKFTRDQRHKINGLLYTSSWIRRLRFKRI